MVKPVYALLGEDSFLQLQALREILREAKDAQRVDVDGERAELAEVFDELQSYAMFGGSRIVVMRNADEFVKKYREPLEGYLQKPSSTGTLVMRLGSLPKNTRVYKLIEKIGVIQACEPPKKYQLPQWIISHAKQAHKLAVAPDAAAILADLVGNSLGRLDSELAKLAVGVDGGKATADDVRKTVAMQSEQEMWDMTNALAAGDRAEAIRRWRQLVQTDSSAEFRAVTWLGMWLENVVKAIQMQRRGVSPGIIARTTRIPEPQVGRFIERAQAMGEAGVARALDRLVEVDVQIKSGLGDVVGNVERFILTV